MNLNDLPSNLPVPEDDGAADHLMGMSLPEVELTATDDISYTLAELQGWAVIYIYPMTGRPGIPLPDNWDEIPGARGCTPQSCAFRDHFAELQALNTQVFGLSSQDTPYQQEARARLELPFNLLSDSKLLLKDKLQLPTFEAEGEELYRRMTLIAHNGVLEQVFYPVFPPSENADAVLAWLRNNSQG